MIGLRVTNFGRLIIYIHIRTEEESRGEIFFSVSVNGEGGTACIKEKEVRGVFTWGGGLGFYKKKNRF
jgi:hypothetical protein